MFLVRSTQKLEFCNSSIFWGEGEGTAQGSKNKLMQTNTLKPSSQSSRQLNRLEIYFMCKIYFQKDLIFIQIIWKLNFKISHDFIEHNYC